MNHPEQMRMDGAGDVSREDHNGLRRAPSARRSFLAVLLGAGVASLGALLCVPLLRFLLHPLVKAKAQATWKEIANVEDLASLTSPVKKLVQVEQRDGWRKIVLQRAVYVCRDERGQPFALSSVCPHLGCSIAWHDEGNRFVCPCHNGQFTADGKLLEGPPPRGMDRLETKVEDGKLVVHYQSFRQLVPNKEVIT